MSERLWYYLQGGNQVGPVPESQVKGLLQSGALLRETMVWSDNLSGWVPAATVAALWAPGPAAQVQERQWHYLEGNAQRGPVPEAQCKELLRSGRLNRDTLVWSEGMANWAPAGTIPAFAGAEPGAVAQAPAAATAQAATAATAQAGAGAAVLTPSEIILLNPEQFAAEGTLLKGGSFQSLTSPAKAGYQELTHALFLGALLANEQAGNVRLSLRPKKAMLGLKTVTVVWVEFMQANTTWPETSFEWFVLEEARKGPREAADIFTTALITMSQYPWSLAANIGCAVLANRGLLQTEEKKKLGFIHTTKFTVPPELPQLMAAHPWQPVRQMLDQCRQGRPDLAQAIAEAVKTAIGRRTEYSE